MGIPDNQEILAMLDRLDGCVADDLENSFVDFKAWSGVKEAQKLAGEYACCFANASGGVVIFGVDDKKLGRAQAIHGVQGYDLHDFRCSIFNGTRPGIEADVEEIDVPEGSGKILVVRVESGVNKPYGTAAGLFKQRVGKNCMPLDPMAFQRAQVSTGAVDWSGAPATSVGLQDLDPLQIERARQILRSKSPSSGLLDLP
ncbi:MAG: ATP-binding protein [Dechloromonas sp.]|nr:ATP-binding protein [Dechloromonas sp.]